MYQKRNWRRRHVEVGADGEPEAPYKYSDEYVLIESQVSGMGWE